MPHPQCSLNETSDFAPISDFALNAHVNDHSMSDGVDAMWIYWTYAEISHQINSRSFLNDIII